MGGPCIKRYVNRYVKSSVQKQIPFNRKCSFYTSREAIHQEIFGILLQKVELPANTDGRAAKEKILKTLVKDKELWAMAMAIESKNSRNANLNAARDVLQWFKKSVLEQELRVGFVLDLSKNDIYALSEICRASPNLKEEERDGSVWETEIETLKKEASDFKETLEKLTAMIAFVKKAAENIVVVEDWKVIIDEVNKRNNDSKDVPVCDVKGDHYWGELLGLVDMVDAVDKHRTSTMFLNVARDCLEDAQRQEQDSRTTEWLISFLIKEALVEFQKACNPLFDRRADHPLEDIAVLMRGIVSEEHLENELKFLISTFSRRSIPCRNMLFDYLKWPTLRGKAEQLIEALAVLGYDPSSENVTAYTIELPTDSKDVKLSHISDMVRSLSEVDKILSKDLSDVTSSLGESRGLLAFLEEIANEDILVLTDAVEEHSDQSVSESVVSDLIDVHRFLCPVLKNKPEDPMRLVKMLREALDQLKTTGMALKIKSCTCNVHSLRMLFMNVANRGEVTKVIIHNALSRGFYQLGRRESGPWQATLSYERTDGRKEPASYNLGDLHDLRSRAHLIISTDKKQAYNEANESGVATTADLLEFIRQVDLITESLQMCEQLRSSGHPRYETYWKKVESLKTVGIEKIENLAYSLQDDLNEWESLLERARKEFYYLNFFHANQLWHLSTFFTGDAAPKRDDVLRKTLDLLRFVDKDIQIGDVMHFRQQFKRQKSMESPERDLLFVGEVLSKIFGSREKVHKVGSPKRQLQGTVKPGMVSVAVLEPGSTRTVQVVMSIFENTIGCVPQPSQVLFCQPDTSWEEVERLLHRSFQVSSQPPEAHVLHCLANVDSLPNDMQFALVATIKKLEASTDAPYLLSLVCRGGQHHHIVDQFSESAHHIGGMTENELRMKLASEFPHVVMVTSELPGLGKTEAIYRAATSRERAVVTLPVSGPFCRRTLVQRLSKLKVKEQDCIHFDIGEVNDPLSLDTFLFEFIVVGMVSSGTEVLHNPSRVITIEVANTLKQWLLDSLPIVKCFQRVTLEWKHYQDLVVTDEITSPIQVVCQYLHAFEINTLENRELVFSGESKLKPLEQERCRELLCQHFSEGSDLTFNIVECFIRVLSCQLLKFSASVFFKPHHLTCMLGPSHDVRTRMFKALLNVSREFAVRSVETCKAVQAKALTKEEATEELMKTQAGSVKTAVQMVDRVKEMIQWTDSNHLLICFQSLVSGSVLALYRDLDEVPKSIRTLFEGQALDSKKLDDLTAISQNELQSKLDQIVCTSPRKSDTGLKSLAYALTLDNVLKMALIFQRIEAHIPVIIMGETGCGKTSLVRYLAKTCEVPLHVFNLHAGVKEEQIVKFVLQKDAEARKGGKVVWVFLDEINTSEYLGCINEIICHRSIHGKPLSSKLVFIAACNPYRLRPTGPIATAGLDGKLAVDESSHLVYRVHPLPETMIDYVWDYGSLSTNDERAYIGRMVESLALKVDRRLLVDLLASSQDHIRKVEGTPYCVSLRDVHRWTLLVKWFYDTLSERPELPVAKVEEHVKKHFEVASSFHLEIRCIILALAHCYQSRISTRHDREAYCGKMADVFQKHWVRVLPGDFEAIVRAEQEEYLARMELPPGTARNAALRENVFVMLVCILNRIPIFVVGKPGCSKSLSMQVIRSNLRGKDMKDPFLKSLPQLYVVAYQGSESSTSEGIEKVFAKARKYKEHNKTSDILPVVLLDEIGLAEVSKYNPLKVLHSLLEPADDDPPDVAVVGISNWALDAAKMNRAIHLSRPEPDVSDLFETGQSIREAHSKTGTTRSRKPYQPEYPDDDQLKCLAEAYHKYQQTQSHENFHGLRDYYSLIKSLSAPSLHSSSLDEMETDNSKRSHRALLRNFGGLPDGLCNIQRLFVNRMEACSVTHESHSFIVTELIRENLHDKDARHLMLITNGDSATGILEQTLEGLSKEKITIFGSHLEEDKVEDYSYRILSRIILCMERDCVLILRDLENIYGSLYDMLNQNYTVIGGKKNCRVALGPFSNPICQVHDGFRCIVLVDQHKVDYTDPPFLNRFEKQLLRFTDVLTPEQRETITELEIWTEDIATIPEAPSIFGKKDMFVGFHEDTLPSLVLRAWQDDGEDKEDVLRRCKESLMWVASPDGVLRSLKSKQADRNIKEIKKLYSHYFDKPIHHGLAHFMDHFIKCGGDEDPSNDEDLIGMRLLVMTHSSIHVNVKTLLDGVAKCHTEKLSSFSSEKQLTKRLQHFWDDPEAEVLALQCKPDLDATHMLLAKSVIEQQRGKYSKRVQGSANPLSKHVLIIVHEQRSQETDDTQRWQFNFLSGWKQVTVDALENPSLPITSILNVTVGDVLDSPALPFAKVAADQLLWCFTRIKYGIDQASHLEAILRLESKLRASTSVVESFKEHVMRWIARQEEDAPSDVALESFQIATWQVSVASDRQTLVNSSTLVGALQQHISHLVRQPLAKIIYFLEKESAWPESVRGDGPIDHEEVEVLQQMLSNNDIFDMSHIPEPQGAEFYSVHTPHIALQFPFTSVLFKKVESFKGLFLDVLRNLQMDENDGKEGSTLPQIQSARERCAEVVREKIPEIFAVEARKRSAAYLEDVLDMKSSKFSSTLSRAQRVSFLKAACGESMEMPNQSDALLLLVTLHSVFWIEEEAIMSAIHLRVASQMISVSSVDLESESIALFNQRSTLSRHLPTDLAGGSFKYTLSVEKEGEEEGDAVNTKAFQAGGNLAGDGGRANKDDQRSSGQTMQESLVLEDLEDEDNVLQNRDGESTSHSPTDNGGSNVDSSEDESGKEEKTEASNSETCGAPRFRERLVHSLCVAMFPTQTEVDRYGGLEGWSQKVSYLIPFMTRVSSEARAYHYLRVCHDFAAILPGSPLPFPLFALGEFGKSAAMYLDSEECFGLVHELVNNLPGVDSDAIHSFCVLFYARCIDSNPDTPLLGPILDKISASTDETALKVVGPVIHRLLLLEESESPGACETVLENPDALEEYPGFQVINASFSNVVQHSQIELDFPCAVICCDLIGEVAFPDMDVGTISGSDDRRLVKVRTATKIVINVDEKEDLFRLLCAVAYLRSFLSAVARFIQEKPNCLFQEGEYSMLLADVNAVVSTAESSPMHPRKSGMQKFLLRGLREGLPLYDVQNLCQRSIKLLSLQAITWQDENHCGKLCFDPLGDLSQTLEPQAAIANLMMKNDDRPMKTLIKTLRRSIISGRDLLVALTKTFYYIRSLRGLRDGEEASAAFIFQTLRAEKLSAHFTAFAACILGREDFKVQELNISTESPVRLLQQTALILHLGAILAPLPCQPENPVPPFLLYLTDPDALTESFILAAPDDPEVGYQTFCHYSTTEMEEVNVYLCPRGVTFSDASGKEVCPVHTNHPAQDDEFKAEETRNKARELERLRRIADKKKMFLCTRRLPPVQFRMLHLLTCTAAYAGYVLGLLDDSAIQTFLRRIACSDHVQSEEDPCRECFNVMMDDIQLLGNLLDVGEEDVLRLLHCALNQVAPLLSENVTLTSADSRTAWEEQFVQTVDPLLHGAQTGKWKSNTGGAQEISSPCLEQQIDETSIPIFEDPSTRTLHIPRLWRTTGQKTLNNLKAFYLMASQQARKTHALLGLFLDNVDTLPLIAHLSSLLRWIRLVDSQLSRRLSRKEAKGLKIGEVICKAGGSKKTSERRVWEDAFEKFRRSWEDIRQYVIATCSLEGMPPLSETSSITFCLLDGREDGIYLHATLQMLQSLQNAFLQKVLAIAAKDRCPALSFLQKAEGASAISTVHLQDAMEREVLHYQWTDEILRHSQRHFEYGRGNEIFYDLEKIEKEVAARFLVGKAYLSTDGGLRMFVFSNELFHTCSNILTDLQQIIPQSSLSQATMKDLCSLKERSLDSIQELLEHLEIVLCMLKKIGGIAKQPLVEFVDHWLSKSRPFPKHLLPEPHPNVQLQHVVSLYQCLEDIFARSSANSVPDVYRKALPKEAKEQMSKMFRAGRSSKKPDDSIISLDDIVTALCRFMYRYLSSEDTRLDPGGDSLAESMMEPSLFPIGSFTSETPQQVRRAIPESLTIDHVHSVFAFYQERPKVSAYFSFQLEESNDTGVGLCGFVVFMRLIRKNWKARPEVISL